MTDTNYKIVSNTLMPPNEKTDKIGCMLSVKHAGCKLARKMTIGMLLFKICTFLSQKFIYRVKNKTQ